MGTSLRTVGGTVAFPVSAEVAFDYLVDPVNRPEWQSSLAAVTDAYDRPRSWSEDGTWKFVTAILDLTFTPTATGCDVGFRFRITGPGPMRALGLLASAASVLPVRADLRTAARVLGERG